MRKFFIIAGGIIGGSFLLYIICSIFLGFKYPILSKYLSGSARVIGKPINATVYTNGHINKRITVYREKTYWDGKKANDYILNLKEFDKYGMLKFIHIDLTEKWIGRPVSTNEADYKVINGNLFQSDISYHNVDFKDDMKGFNFDPHLSFTVNEIKFNVPPGTLKFDSVRIVLNR